MSESGWQGLTEDEKQQVQHLWMSALRARETVFLQVESGLLEPEAKDYLGFGGNWGDLYGFRVLWPTLRGNLGPNFAHTLEEELGLLKD